MDRFFRNARADFWSQSGPAFRSAVLLLPIVHASAANQYNPIGFGSMFTSPDMKGSQYAVYIDGFQTWVDQSLSFNLSA